MTLHKHPAQWCKILKTFLTDLPTTYVHHFCWIRYKKKNKTEKVSIAPVKYTMMLMLLTSHLQSHSLNCWVGVLFTLTGRGRLRLAPYQWYSARHTGSGTISKSLPGTSCKERFSLPPSMVNVGALRDKAQTSQFTQVFAWKTIHLLELHIIDRESILILCTGWQPAIIRTNCRDKTKGQEAPSGPWEPWLSDEELFRSGNHKSVKPKRKLEKSCFLLQMPRRKISWKICICRLSKGLNHICLFNAWICTRSQ